MFEEFLVESSCANLSVKETDRPVVLERVDEVLVSRVMYCQVMFQGMIGFL